MLVTTLLRLHVGALAGGGTAEPCLGANATESRIGVLMYLTHEHSLRFHTTERVLVEEDPAVLMLRDPGVHSQGVGGEVRARFLNSNNMPWHH